MRNADWNKEFPEVPDMVHDRVMEALEGLEEENGGNRRQDGSRQQAACPGQWGRVGESRETDENKEVTEGRMGNMEGKKEKGKPGREKEGKERGKEKPGREKEKRGEEKEKQGREEEKQGREKEKQSREKEKQGREKEKQGREKEMQGRKEEKGKQRKDKTGKAGKKHSRAGRRLPAAAAVVAAVFLAASGSCYAAWKYLSLRQVADELEDGKLAEAFESEAAVNANEVQELGGYRITFMGAVAGKDISRFAGTDEDGGVEDDKLYTVVTIEHMDGTPMPEVSAEEYGQEAFYVSPYIQGLNPAKYSIMSMGGGYSEFVKDGIQYRLTEVDNLEAFADRKLYLGVSSGTFYDPEAYSFDEATGEIGRKDGYRGVNALFSLPLGASKADPDAAKAYLEQLEASWEADDGEIEMDETDLAVETWMEKVTPENIEEYAEVIESTVKTYTPDAGGEFRYSWESGSGSGGSGTAGLEWLFPDRKPGRVIAGYSYSEEGLAGLEIETFTLNEDGTVTLAVYVPKAGE